MKKLILLLFLGASFYSLTLKDNAEFKGKVLDHQNGLVLIGAKVEHSPSKTSTITDHHGVFRFSFTPKIGDTLIVTYIGYEIKYHTIQSLTNCLIRLQPHMLKEEMVVRDGEANQLQLTDLSFAKTGAPTTVHSDSYYEPYYYQPTNTETYDEIKENEFLAVVNKPLSTFSIDVDGAAYSNVRRFINQGVRPPKDAVRIEELINYFDYDYSVDFNHKPFGLHYEIGPCPWNEKHQLIHVGIQGKQLETNEIPASNLVFLIDVSGSMRHQNKLPLLIESFKMLVNQLGEQDRVSIVTYAGQAGIVLPPTSGSDRTKILQALDQLQAGGSTAGAQGIVTAYDLAAKHYIKNGNNRVIIATDGDFNVGISGDIELEDLIKTKRDNGIFLNVLGFGMGNYKDSKMQRLANQGNGQHAYIDNIHEARKVFIDELQGTLFTIAKDVKIQIEFNPAYVDHYRLIGYENRLLKDRDFNDDKKDAGEIGAGHSVTVLYEIVPHGVVSNINNIDPLKYQDKKVAGHGKLNGELATLKIRHKDVNSSSKNSSSEISEKQTWVIKPMRAFPELSQSYYWSSAMACFGMALRQSDHLVHADFKLAEELALKGKGIDPWGYRSEAINLIRSADAMFGNHSVHEVD